MWKAQITGKTVNLAQGLIRPLLKVSAVGRADPAIDTLGVFLAQRTEFCLGFGTSTLGRDNIYLAL